MERPTLILGATGQVGSALCTLLGPRAIPLARSEADLENPSGLENLLNHYDPSAVINAAAYTQVDRAEQEEDRARRINAEAPEAVAKWCKKRAIPLIHYSTDYVFSGEGSAPWREADPTEPLSAYGRTKLEGENRIASVGGKWITLRTSWVYDATGKNFLTTMLRLGKEREHLRVVNDQHGAPTFALHLAKATLDVLKRFENSPGFPSGVYHLCNAGETTWHAFAQAIFEEARYCGFELKVRDLEPIPTSGFPTPAKRPLNSRLNTSKAARILGVSLPDWRLGLKECMENLK